MNKAVELLRECQTFFLATDDNGQPRVRPFGAVADINGKLYICTNNTKDCFKQMMKNPKVEISAVIEDEKWLRICGTVKVDSSMEAREEFLKQVPLDMYKADDGIFEVLYFTEATLTVYSFTEEPEVFAI